ncbi:nuclease [Chytridiales sp. JEL 0842]|nr:nuclease [Chytridiales sp. JEL 0842]
MAGVAVASSVLTATTLYFAGALTKPSSPTATTPPWKRSPQQQQQQQQTILLPSSADRMKDILRHGFPGPVADKLYRTAYVGVYDRRTKNAHWVAEYLTKSNLSPNGSDPSGPPDRKHSHFKEDPTIPEPFRAKLHDYINSGHDRGHLVPAADIHDSQDSINESFLLSNISPQHPSFNRGIWASFERYIRSLVQRSTFEELRVVTGPLYLPKQDKSDGKFYVKYEVIGPSKNVAVPTHFFKVILGTTKEGKHYLGGFVMPNEGVSRDTPLEVFVTPVEAIERSSGIEFFPMLKRGNQTGETGGGGDVLAGDLCQVAPCKAMLAFKFKAKELLGE